MDVLLELGKLAASVLVGFGAAYLAVRGQLGGMRDQRRQARIEEAYRLAAAYAVWARQYALLGRAGMGPDDPLLPQRDETEHWRTHALMDLFASEPVRAAYDDVLADMAVLRAAIGSFTEARDTQAAGPDDLAHRKDVYERFTAARESVERSVDVLLGKLRSELN